MMKLPKKWTCGHKMIHILEVRALSTNGKEKKVEEANIGIQKIMLQRKKQPLFSSKPIQT